MAKKHLKRTLLSAAVAAALLTTAMPADAVKFTASGQINKVMSDIDNGNESALGFFDNDFSGTRFRFKGSEELDNGITIGGYTEYQMSGQGLSGAAFQPNGEFGEANGTLQERHTDIYASSSWGKVSLGQGNGAANGTSEVDLSGTWRTDYVHGNQCALGGITFGNTSVTDFSNRLKKNVRYHGLATPITPSPPVPPSRSSQIPSPPSPKQSPD